MTVAMKFSRSAVAALHRGLDLALTLPVPAVAAAGVRPLTLTYDAPTPPRSPTPEPPITHTKPCTQSPGARDDEGAGTLEAQMTLHATAWQDKLPGTFTAHDLCENANSDAARIVARSRCTVVSHTHDHGNPAHSTDASRPSVPA